MNEWMDGWMQFLYADDGEGQQAISSRGGREGRPTPFLTPSTPPTNSNNPPNPRHTITPPPPPQILREQNETYKLAMYTRLSSTIVFFVTLFGALTVVVLLARVG